MEESPVQTAVPAGIPEVVSVRDEPTPAGRRSPGAALGSLATRYGVLVVLIAVLITARIAYEPFFSVVNMSNLFSQIAPTAVVAVGMTLLLISAGFDLSVGAVFGGASVVYASLSGSMPLLPAFIATLIVGILCGIINGLLVTRLNVNAFIATLGTASVFSGMAYVYSHDVPIVSTAKGFDILGNGQFLSIWWTVWVLAAIALILGLILAYTPYGRNIYAVGGNLEAARMVGVRVNVVRVSTFAITSMCAAVGGMFVASQTGVGQASLGGWTVTLDAVTIVIIGGTALFGGKGSMWRTVVGILIWGTVINLLSVLALGTSAQILIQGVVLLFAVGLQAIPLMRRR